MRNRLMIVLGFAALMAATTPARAEIAGTASVIDGDTIEIHRTRIRLFGIDAPESSQLCESGGKKYRCGQQAALALDGMTAGKTVRCQEKDRDRYGRTVAECFTGSTSLNGWMVAQGWAVAYRQYSKAFIPQEEDARRARRGIWQGSFQMPADYRRKPSPEEQAAHGECLIKGNINSKGGRLYHLPGSSGYGKTKIDTAKGERWFCSEDEARAAGWTTAKRR